jgi:hypothetical protein
VRHLTPDEVRRVRDELMRLPLATWRYRDAPQATPPRLGFVIDEVAAENPATPAVLPNGRQVDVYGFASMAVAAVQAQQAEIDALRAEIEALRQQLSAALPPEATRVP